MDTRKLTESGANSKVSTFSLCCETFHTHTRPQLRGAVCDIHYNLASLTKVSRYEDLRENAVSNKYHIFIKE